MLCDDGKLCRVTIAPYELKTEWKIGIQGVKVQRIDKRRNILRKMLLTEFAIAIGSIHHQSYADSLLAYRHKLPLSNNRLTSPRQESMIEPEDTITTHEEHLHEALLQSRRNQHEAVTADAYCHPPQNLMIRHRSQRYVRPH